VRACAQRFWAALVVQAVVALSHVAEHDRGEFPMQMRRSTLTLLILPVVVAAAVAVSTLAVSTAWARDGHSLKDTARQLVTAGFAGDRPAATKLVLTFEQLSAMTTKEISRADYDKEVDDFLAHLQQPGAVPELKIEEVVYLPAGSSGKRKKDIVLAVVTPIFTDAKETERWAAVRGPFYFIQTDQGWRLSIKK
jgi:hypothetical protein